MDMLPRLVERGLEGIEYRHHTQTPERQAAVLEAAGRYGLFLTGGSDFHGLYAEKALPPGSSGMELAADHPLIRDFF
jgi:hypothetical protein